MQQGDPPVSFLIIWCLNLSTTLLDATILWSSSNVSLGMLSSLTLPLSLILSVLKLRHYLISTSYYIYLEMDINFKHLAKSDQQFITALMKSRELTFDNENGNKRKSKAAASGINNINKAQLIHNFIMGTH